MDGISDLGLFIVAGLLLSITPGPDLLYICSRSAVQGKKAGVVAALGIATGCFVHIASAAFGLSVILLSSAMLFTAVKIAGAVYLLYIGIKTLRSIQKNDQPAPHCSALPLGSIFRQAVLINVLNPKVALFFLALLPQFVRPDAASPATAFLFLGLLFNINGSIINILFALFSSVISKQIRATRSMQRFLKTVTGALFVAFGIRLAFTS